MNPLNFFRRRECPSHDMEPVIFPPPKFEAIFDDKDEQGFLYLWNGTILVCRHCWQVELRANRLETVAGCLHTEGCGCKGYVRQTMLNKGNRS